MIDKSSESGWRSLTCSYFAAVCREILSHYFERFGFIETTQSAIGGVYFKRDDVFIEISYEPETYPKYSPSVIVGIGDAKYDDSGLPCGVPLWYVVPQRDAVPRYTSWTFSNEGELRATLLRIREEVLEGYAAPLWSDRDYLNSVIVNFRRIVQHK